MFVGGVGLEAVERDSGEEGIGREPRPACIGFITASIACANRPNQSRLGASRSAAVLQML